MPPSPTFSFAHSLIPSLAHSALQAFLSSSEKLKQDLFSLILIVADKDIEGAKAAVQEHKTQSEADANAKLSKRAGIYVRVDSREDQSGSKPGEWARLLARNGELGVTSFDATVAGAAIKAGDSAMKALSPVFCNAASGKQAWVLAFGRRKERIMFDSGKQPGLMTLGVQRVAAALATAGRDLDDVEFVVTSVELFDGRWRDLVSAQHALCHVLHLSYLSLTAGHGRIQGNQQEEAQRFARRKRWSKTDVYHELLRCPP